MGSETLVAGQAFEIPPTQRDHPAVARLFQLGILAADPGAVTPGEIKADATGFSLAAFCRARLTPHGLAVLLRVADEMKRGAQVDRFSDLVREP